VSYNRGTFGITGYVNTFDAKDTFLIMFDPEGQAIQWRAKAQIYHVDVNHFHLIRSKHYISYGGSFRHMNIRAELMPGIRHHSEGGAYFQYEMWPSNRFRWIVDARIDKTDVLRRAVFSPRTTFMVKPAHGQTFRLSYNRAFVAPWTLLNYFQSIIGNRIDLGLIDPRLAGVEFPFTTSVIGNKDIHEHSQNAYEAGYAASLADDRIHLSAALYVNDSRGTLYWNQTGSYTSEDPPADWPLPPLVLDALIAGNALGPGKGLPSYITPRNLGRVRNKGFELEADARINRWLTMNANHSWQARPQADAYDLSIVNLPPSNRFNACLNLDRERYLANVSVRHVSSAWWRDVINQLFAGPTNAYTVVSATGGIRWGGGQYRVMLKVSNLLNTPIQNHVWGDILKRQITGEFRVRF
jgi:outer membrane receptor protein involved in Fe transport